MDNKTNSAYTQFWERKEKMFCMSTQYYAGSESTLQPLNAALFPRLDFLVCRELRARSFFRHQMRFTLTHTNYIQSHSDSYHVATAAVRRFFRGQTDGRATVSLRLPDRFKRVLFFACFLPSCASLRVNVTVLPSSGWTSSLLLQSAGAPRD